jgi:hypothetical protein
MRYCAKRAFSEKDLNWMYRYASEFFGERISTYDQMMTCHRKNSGIYWVVKKITSKSNASTETNVGYFCVFPLNKSATLSVERGELDGSKITREHIASKFAAAAGLYIGAIAARQHGAKGCAIFELKQMLDWHRYRNCNRIYAKAATEDGLRLLKKHGFRPLSGTDKGVLGDIFFIGRGDA